MLFPPLLPPRQGKPVTMEGRPPGQVISPALVPGARFRPSPIPYPLHPGQKTQPAARGAVLAGNECGLPRMGAPTRPLAGQVCLVHRSRLSRAGPRGKDRAHPGSSRPRERGRGKRRTLAMTGPRIGVRDTHKLTHAGPFLMARPDRLLQNSLLRARDGAPNGEPWNMASHSSTLSQLTRGNVRLKKSRKDGFARTHGKIMYRWLLWIRLF